MPVLREFSCGIRFFGYLSMPHQLQKMKFSPESFGLKNLASAAIIASVLVWIGISVIQRKSGGDVYPSKYVDIICPFSAGGGTDLLCRTMADAMSREFGLPVNVQNISGGGGALGHVRGAAAAADGYTLTMVTFELITLSQRGFAPISSEDFALVGRLNADPSCIAVRSDFPAKNLAGLLEKASGTRKLKFGNSGIGSVWHLAAEHFAGKCKMRDFRKGRFLGGRIGCSSGFFAGWQSGSLPF